MSSTAAPVPTSRSMQMVVVSRNATSTPKSSASVASMTSFWTSPKSDTESSPRSSSCRTLINGSCSASRVSAVCRAPRPAPRRGSTTVSSVGGAKACSDAGRARPTASPTRLLPRPQTFAICPAENDGARHAAPSLEDADRGDLLLGPRPTATGPASAPSRRTAARRRPCRPAGPRSILKTVPETGPSASPCDAGSSSVMPADSAVEPGTGDGRAEEHRVHPRRRGLGSEHLAQPRVRDARLVVDVRREQRLVVLGQQLEQAGHMVACRRHRSGVTCASRVPRSATEVIGVADGSSVSASRASTPSYCAPTRSILLTNTSVGMPQSLQRPHQHAGLRLHAFHRGDDEHRAVEHVEHPLHLGDEVRVAGCVDQVDRDVAEHERHDGRLDRDAALAFQREDVGLGAAVVDAADLVDDAGGVEQLLGQAGLTGVDMRQDPQVECSQRFSCPRSRWLWPS